MRYTLGARGLKYEKEFKQYYINKYKEDSKKLRREVVPELYTKIQNWYYEETNKLIYAMNKKNNRLSRNKTFETRKCVVCGKEFEVMEYSQKRTCSSNCKSKMQSERNKDRKCDCFMCVNWHAGNEECGRQAFNDVILPHIQDYYISINNVVIPTKCDKFKEGKKWQ